MRVSRITVAITGLSAADNPAPGVAVARCLRAAPEFQGKLIGLTFDHRHTGLYASRMFDEVFLIPAPAQGAGAFVKAIAHVCRAHPIQVLLPTLDPEVLLLAKVERELNELGIRCLLPDERQIKRRAKPVLPELARRVGFGSPKTVVLSSKAALGNAIQSLSYPFYLKGSFTDAQLVSTPDEVEPVFARLLGQWGLPLLAQERVSGEELNLAVLADESHRLVGAVPMKKLGLTDRGKGWAGITVLLPEVIARAELLLRSIRWVGPAEIEMIHDPLSGTFYLIEVNPRFPAWIALTPAAGQNLPWKAVRLAMGLPVAPTPGYSVGRLFTRTVEDFFHPYDRVDAFAKAEALQ